MGRPHIHPRIIMGVQFRPREMPKLILAWMSTSISANTQFSSECECNKTALRLVQNHSAPATS